MCNRVMQIAGDAQSFFTDLSAGFGIPCLHGTLGPLIERCNVSPLRAGSVTGSAGEGDDQPELERSGIEAGRERVQLSQQDDPENRASGDGHCPPAWPQRRDLERREADGDRKPG